MDEEIYLTRNDALEVVPAEASIVTVVNYAWTTIRKHIYDGGPVGHLLRGVEESLSVRRNAIISGGLDARYDWEYDLACARFNHRFHLSWMDWNKETRQKTISFWADNAAENFRYLRELSLNGFKTIVLMHGAVAIGSVNILAQKRDAISASTVFAAKLALIFAIIGIISAGLGQLATFDALSKLFGRIQGKLASIPRWQKIRAFSKYSQKFQPILRTSTYLIYGSIFWFCIYSVVLFIVLISEPV